MADPERRRLRVDGSARFSSDDRRWCSIRTTMFGGFGSWTRPDARTRVHLARACVRSIGVSRSCGYNTVRHSDLRREYRSGHGSGRPLHLMR